MNLWLLGGRTGEGMVRELTRRKWMGTNIPLGKNVPGQRYKHLNMKSFRKH